MTTDQNGNTYSYDAQNRLIKAVSKGGSNTVIMAYDPQNRVVARMINSSATYYVYDNWKLLAEYDDYGVEDAYYVHGPRADEPLTLNISTGGTSYYIQDGNGNVTTMTDTSGNVIERYTYDPFGNVTITGPTGTTQSTSSVGNRFMFTGREYIAQIKLYDFRSRVYSPGLGRFIQSDPMRFQAGDNNIYRYCGNNPISGADPMGLCGQFTTDNDGSTLWSSSNPSQPGPSDSDREAQQTQNDPTKGANSPDSGSSTQPSPNQSPNTNPSSPPGPTPPPPAPDPTPAPTDTGGGGVGGSSVNNVLPFNPNQNLTSWPAGTLPVLGGIAALAGAAAAPEAVIGAGVTEFGYLASAVRDAGTAALGYALTNPQGARAWGSAALTAAGFSTKNPITDYRGYIGKAANYLINKINK
jgi:RHS repeat-associated protein